MNPANEDSAASCPEFADFVPPNESTLGKALAAKLEIAMAANIVLKINWTGQTGDCATDNEDLAESLAEHKDITFSPEEIVTILKAAPFNRGRIESEDYWQALAQKGMKEGTLLCLSRTGLTRLPHPPKYQRVAQEPASASDAGNSLCGYALHTNATPRFERRSKKSTSPPAAAEFSRNKPRKSAMLVGSTPSMRNALQIVHVFCPGFRTTRCYPTEPCSVREALRCTFNGTSTAMDYLRSDVLPTTRDRVSAVVAAVSPVGKMERLSPVALSQTRKGVNPVLSVSCLQQLHP